MKFSLYLSGDSWMFSLLPPHTHRHTRGQVMSVLFVFLWEEGVTGQQERPGLLFHWSTPTSYFLDDPPPSGEVIGWEEKASWEGSGGVAVGYSPRPVTPMSRRTSADDQTSRVTNIFSFRHLKRLRIRMTRWFWAATLKVHVSGIKGHKMRETWSKSQTLIHEMLITCIFPNRVWTKVIFFWQIMELQQFGSKLMGYQIIFTKVTVSVHHYWLSAANMLNFSSMSIRTDWVISILTQVCCGSHLELDRLSKLISYRCEPSYYFLISVKFLSCLMRYFAKANTNKLMKA